MAKLKATFHVKKDIGYDELEITTSADGVTYGGGTSGLSATDVQSAIDEVVTETTASLNTKQATITGGATTIATSNLTVNKALISDANGKVSTSATSNTEIGYLSGVTSAVQTQLNAKQTTITGGATTIATSNLSANRALVSDGSGKVSASSITSTILGYLANVTSDIQTQLNRLPVGSRVLVQSESLDGLPNYGTWLTVNPSTYFIPSGEGRTFEDRYEFYYRQS